MPFQNQLKCNSTDRNRGTNSTLTQPSDAAVALNQMKKEHCHIREDRQHQNRWEIQAQKKDGREHVLFIGKCRKQGWKSRRWILGSIGFLVRLRESNDTTIFICNHANPRLPHQMFQNMISFRPLKMAESCNLTK